MKTFPRRTDSYNKPQIVELTTNFYQLGIKPLRSSQTDNINTPDISDDAKNAHILLGLQSGLLMSINVFNNNCLDLLNRHTVRIFKWSETKNATVMDITILKDIPDGQQNSNTGIWDMYIRELIPAPISRHIASTRLQHFSLQGKPSPTVWTSYTTHAKF